MLTPLSLRIFAWISYNPTMGNLPLKSTKVGSFGGQGGIPWDDGAYTTVRQVIIHYDDAVIKSIQVEYDKNGRPKWGVQHGSSCGGKAVISLDFPAEFLVSISGHFTKDCSCTTLIRSLTFVTNKKKYGPFGMEKGNTFSTSTTIGKIIGFFGRSGLELDAIGAYVEEFPCPYNPKIDGPHGGNGGIKWDDGLYTTVRQLVVHSGDAIDSVQIEYDKNGHSVWSKKHGESIGGTRHNVKLDYPAEFIIAISGSYKGECGINVIRSLKIITNKKTYGPFGNERGTFFESPKENGMIIGFLGNAGNFLDSIGVHYSPFPDPPRPLSCGPFGSLAGCAWDDGFYTTIRQLIIYSGNNIESIQIVYDKKGHPISSEKHGTSTCGTKNMVSLNYPAEYVLSVSGHYGGACGCTSISSLKIVTNKATYGPFGVEQGTAFKFPPADGRVVGFLGRASNHLNAIGGYYEPCPIG